MRLVVENADDEPELYFDVYTSELLYGRILEAKDAEELPQFTTFVAERLRDALHSNASRELLRPTAAQVTYAVDIARELGLSIPADVFRYRGNMHRFIEAYAAHFRAQFYGGVRYHG